MRYREVHTSSWFSWADLDRKDAERIYSLELQCLNWMYNTAHYQGKQPNPGHWLPAESRSTAAHRHPHCNLKLQIDPPPPRRFACAHGTSLHCSPPVQHTSCTPAANNNIVLTCDGPERARRGENFSLPFLQVCPASLEQTGCLYF